MEWNKVKSILIVLLLLVDVILGVTVAEQYLQVRTRERASVSDAAQLLRRDGLRFDEQMFFDLPVHLSAWTIPRDDATELRVATALLGECESETAGGGIAVYRSERGRVVFRTGGIFEADWSTEGLDTDGQDAAAAFSAVLKKLNVRAEVDGAYATLRAADGVPVVNARLQYSGTEKSEKLSGLWLFDAEQQETRAPCTRAQMMLALRAVVPEKSELTECTVGYFAREQHTGVRLEPVWCVTADGQPYYVSGLTGNRIFPFGLGK